MWTISNACFPASTTSITSSRAAEFTTWSAKMGPLIPLLGLLLPTNTSVDAYLPHFWRGLLHATPRHTTPHAYYILLLGSPRLVLSLIGIVIETRTEICCSRSCGMIRRRIFFLSILPRSSDIAPLFNPRGHLPTRVIRRIDILGGLFRRFFCNWHLIEEVHLLTPVLDSHWIGHADSKNIHAYT